MRVFFLVFLFLIVIAGCKTEKKPEPKSVEDTATESLPENIGDKNAPTAIKALKGAKAVKKHIDEQRKQDSKVLEQTN